MAGWGARWLPEISAPLSRGISSNTWHQTGTYLPSLTHQRGEEPVGTRSACPAGEPQACSSRTVSQITLAEQTCWLLKIAPCHSQPGTHRNILKTWKRWTARLHTQNPLSPHLLIKARELHNLQPSLPLNPSAQKTKTKNTALGSPSNHRPWSTTLRLPGHTACLWPASLRAHTQAYVVVITAEYA